MEPDDDGPLTGPTVDVDHEQRLDESIDRAMGRYAELFRRLKDT